MADSRRRLIVTADDFGLTEGVNRGIVEAVRAGSVSAASLMTGAPGWEDALARLEGEVPGLSVGLHLNLTVGRPLTAARTLCDPGGSFLSLPALTLRGATGRIEAREVFEEASAQLDALSAAGVTPTHLDGHRHVHLLPGVGRAVLEVARRAGVRHVRVPLEPMGSALRRPGVALKQAALRVSAIAAGVPMTSRVGFRGQSLLDARDPERALLQLVGALPAGVTEIAVHPGYVTPELAALDPYTYGRERELVALTSARVLARLRDGSVGVVGFASL